jgi:uncharacterized protein (TIGR03435 family)
MNRCGYNRLHREFVQKAQREIGSSSVKNITLLSLLTVLTAFAQQPKFEIADVHASKTVHGFAQNFGGVLREGRYVNRDATMLKLIEAAYGVSEDTISGGPGWMNSDLFDVIAKVSDGTTPATAKLMLQALLTDRFSLVIHKGMSPVPRYMLSVGKGGSKLKPAGGSGSPGCQPLQQGGGGSAPNDPASQPNIKVACQNLTAATIAENLHQMAGGYLDHDVIDSTKLEGTWDFNLEWTGRGALAAKGAEGIFYFRRRGQTVGFETGFTKYPDGVAGH